MDQSQLALFMVEMQRLQAAYRTELDSLSLKAYQEALDGLNITRLPEVVLLIVRGEKYFPPAATIIKYFKELPELKRLELPKPEPTPDQLRRSELVKYYWLREFSVEDDKARVKIRAGQSQADLERFVKEHWDDINIPRDRGKGFERIAKGR